MDLSGQLMEEAITHARRAMGKTHPNPAVGAVIAHQGQVVASGFTQPAGSDHAEIVALKAFRESGHQPDDTTVLAVTLEPCSTSGRTGPCTQAIIESGIGQVLIGAIDPDPRHQGRGVDVLREAGLTVQTGIREPECRHLNLIFNWWMEHRGPLIAGKIATTIDGRIATRGGLSKWITGPEARADVHRWRRYFPAIAVGAGTVLSDDPALTARVEGEDPWCPVRFIFDRNLVTFKDGLPEVYQDPWKDRTVIVANIRHDERIQELHSRYGLQFWALSVDESEDGGLSEFVARCQEEDIRGVYVEGGAQLLSSFLNSRQLHYLFTYRAPKLLADGSALSPFIGREPESMRDAIRLSDVRQARFGDDQLLSGFVVYPVR